MIMAVPLCRIDGEMPSYRWKKYCLNCHYRLGGAEVGQSPECSECGQAFDPDDDTTWSKRPYSLDYSLRLRRWMVVVFVVAVLLVGAGLALLFPASSLVIILVAALPVVAILALWVIGLDVVDLTQLVVLIKMPVKEEVAEQEVSLDSLIGKSGRVTVTLKPVGRIVIEGQAYEAKSESTLVEVGATVHVVGSNEWMLIVRGEDG